MSQSVICIQLGQGTFSYLRLTVVLHTYGRHFDQHYGPYSILIVLSLVHHARNKKLKNINKKTMEE